MHRDGSNYRPTVVLADDHGNVSSIVTSLLGDEFEVVAAVCDGAKAVQAAREFHPDIVILDICMPGLDGIQAARAIRSLRLSAKLVFLTIQKDSDYVEAACALGASYVLKSRMDEDLMVALKESLEGRTFVSRFSGL